MEASDLSREEKKKALESLIFVTEKRNGDIKARKVTDGNKQHVNKRKYILNLPLTKST